MLKSTIALFALVPLSLFASSEEADIDYAHEEKSERTSFDCFDEAKESQASGHWQQVVVENCGCNHKTNKLSYTIRSRGANVGSIQGRLNSNICVALAKFKEVQTCHFGYRHRGNELENDVVGEFSCLPHPEEGSQ